MKAHDISAGTVRLNFDQLLRTANIAIGLSKTACERNLHQVQQASFASRYRELDSAAQQLAEHADALRIAAATLLALEESRSREELVVERNALSLAA